MPSINKTQEDLYLISDRLRWSMPWFLSHDEAEEFIEAYSLVRKVIWDTIKALWWNIQERINQACFLIYKYPHLFEEFRWASLLNQAIAQEVLSKLSEAHKLDEQNPQVLH